MMTVGIILGLLIAGGVFFSGGLEARRKAAYPYQWLDVSFQLTVGGVALLIGALGVLGLLIRILGALF